MSPLLHKPGSCFVEPIRNSGLTESGIYVFDHDETRDMEGHEITINYRVLDAYKCDEIQVGKVYVVQNPYNYTDFEYDGKRYYEMLESNFICELEGYDEVGEFRRDHVEAEAYQVCGK